MGMNKAKSYQIVKQAFFLASFQKKLIVLAFLALPLPSFPLPVIYIKALFVYLGVMTFDEQEQPNRELSQ